SYATFIHLVAGGAAGTFGAIVTCPLEVLKTRLQSSTAKSTLINNNNTGSLIGADISKLASNHKHKTSTSASTHHLRSAAAAHKRAVSFSGLPIIDCFKTIVRNEGWRALFKGLGPNLVGVAPSRAIYFCTYSNVKSFLNSSFQSSSESPIIHMTSAASAGFVSCTATNPIWFVKTRLQLSNDSMTVMQCMKSIYKSAGALGFYKGITASYMGISETIIHFVIYEFMKSQIQQRRSMTLANQSTISSASSGHQTVNMQQNVVSNTRTGESSKPTQQTDKYTGNVQLEQQTVVLRNAQSDSVASGDDPNSNNNNSTTNDIGKSNNPQLDYYIFLQYMIASAFSKTIASSLAYPHEVARTRLREEGDRYQRFCQTIVLVWREEGLVGLYRGLSIQLLRSIPFTAVTMSTYELLVTIMSSA
ncbi:Mitochondrial carrier protein Rim2, partial [Fragariocoptes setiger]